MQLEPVELDVIIPAGGEIDEAFSKVVGTKSKALITFDGVTVLEMVINALRESGRVRRIIVVGSKLVLAHDVVKKADDALPEGKSGPENIFRGLDELLKAETKPTHVMIVTCDLPFLTGASINNFLDLCSLDQDFCVPLVSQDEYLEAYPGSDSTFVKLKDGTWTAGCVYLTTVKGLQIAVRHIEQIFQRRKSKLGMARLLGFRFTWDYVFQKLSVSDVEKKATQLLGCKGTAIPGAPPELAQDIDATEDYHYILQFIKSRQVAHR